ncbi:MAG: hypothetical protein V1835_04790 [Candidatus Micrarchaeota archaeon]
MTTYFPSDETSWTLLALLLLYVMFSSGVQLSMPALGAIAFVGLMVVGTAQTHH